MRHCLLVMLVLSFVRLSAAQDTAKPNQWRGLVLDEASAEQAIQALGRPSSDKQDGVFARPIQRWFRPDLAKKIFRCLTFKEVEGFNQVKLYLLDGKLAVVQLWVKSDLRPTALGNIYGLEFQPMMGGLEESMGIVDRHQGRAYPKRFPSFYNVVAVAPGAVVNASISNSSVGAILSQSLGSGIDAAGGGFPGKVTEIQLISRRLEEKGGAELLK